MLQSFRRSYVLLFAVAAISSQNLYCQYTHIDTIRLYDGWYQLSLDPKGLDYLRFGMKYEGDHSFIMHGIYSDYSGYVESDTTTSAEVVSYKDNFYYNFPHFSKRSEDVHFFVQMNIVGYYSLLLFPEKRGEIAMYRSRITHEPMIVWLIKDLFFPEKREHRLFKDKEGFEYQVLLFDPHYSPKNYPEIKGPKPVWLDPEELRRILEVNPEFSIDKPFSSYKVEEILDLFIALNRKEGRSLYESDLGYLEGF